MSYLPKIVCSALKDSNGAIILGARHFDSLMVETLKNGSYSEPFEQGFIDQFGVFYRREDAFKIAQKNNQILNKSPHNTKLLFSENLY